jgi:hypothetical protein
MTQRLAQINIGRLIAPVDDPKITEFVAQLDPVNALADTAPGFVWRLQSSSGNATDIVYNDDPFVIVNMSVWESVEALRGPARLPDPLGGWAKWFEKMEKPHYCLWWIQAPTFNRCRGRERLEHYQQHGATLFSFCFETLSCGKKVRQIPN